jgi:manganese/zinc/iron transport system substrate-binding protein
MRWVQWACLAGLLAAAGGCRPAGGESSPPDLSGRKARVLATTGMIADAARNVAGDLADVDVLMGPGVDPHLYQPSPRDVQKLRSADLVLYNGLHLEGKMDDVLARQARSVAVTRSLPPEDLRPAPPGAGGAHDPHVWFDVALWSKCTGEIEQALARLDPAHAADYTRNAAAYRERLAELDRYVRKQAGSLPPERRVLITAHDAFYYFGHAYGFEVHGLQGISTVAEVSIADVGTLADVIGKGRVPAVFTETTVPAKGLEAVRAAVKDRHGFDVRLVADEEHKLFSDALGEAGTPTGTYEGMVRHNIDVIVGALR